MSPNIFYTGATPNQQLIPAAEFLMSREGGSKKKFYLLGTDYVFPRTANRILTAYLLSVGIPRANIVEEYTPFGHADYRTIVRNLKEFGKNGDAAVLSTINGDSNVPFYSELATQGISAATLPVMAFSIAEDELRLMDTRHLVGHLAAWTYYQSIDTPENRQFVEAFKTLRGEERTAGWAQPGHRRPDRSSVLWRLRVEGGGREGAVVRGVEGSRGRPRPRVRRPRRPQTNASEQSAHVQAGLHRTDSRRRAVRGGLADGGVGGASGIQRVPEDLGRSARLRPGRADGRRRSPAETSRCGGWRRGVSSGAGQCECSAPPPLPNRSTAARTAVASFCAGPCPQ